MKTCTVLINLHRINNLLSWIDTQPHYDEASIILIIYLMILLPIRSFARLTHPLSQPGRLFYYPPSITSDNFYISSPSVKGYYYTNTFNQLLWFLC